MTDLIRRFSNLYGNTPEPEIATAPGRVNLIGEHTDYNDGWVLPMAIDRQVRVAFAGRDDARIRAHAAAFDQTREVQIADLEPPGDSEWISYVAGVAWALTASGHDLAGADLVIDGDVPIGSGLSSSAAIEMATARALSEVSGIPWSPVEMALLGQKVESEYIGIKGGVMDQFIATMGRAGHALQLDCRSLETETVPLPDDAVVVVMDTGAPRTLAGSAYNERSRSCREAVRALREIEPAVRALRDVDADLLLAASDRLDEETFRRASHVVAENRRPQAMAEALRRGDLAAAGRLMDESHFSLRDLYEVSSDELDLFTEAARRHPACFGARLTGAGFGGCAIALVSAGDADSFIDDVHSAYRERVDLPSSCFACRAADGARLVAVDGTEARGGGDASRTTG
jgi:galactokinase